MSQNVLHKFLLSSEFLWSCEIPGTYPTPFKFMEFIFIENIGKQTSVPHLYAEKYYFLNK